MSSRVSNWLASGRTPSTWQREMAQNTAWLKALSSASTWTEELIALQPMLNNEPLLGRSLALLTTEFTRQAQTPSGTAHETRVRPARMQSPRGQQGAQGSQRLPKLERPFTGNNEMPPRQTGTDFSARRSAAVHKSAHFPGEIEHGQLTTRQRGKRANTSRIVELDRQVDHSLLSRRAGNSPVPDTVAARPRQRSFVRGNGQKRSMMVQERPFSSQSWPSSLIAKTRHVLDPASQPTSTRTKYQAAALYAEHQPTTMYIEQEELLLPRQWSTTIGEPTVPLELLLHYATLPRQGSAAASGNERVKDSMPSPLIQESRIAEKSNAQVSENGSPAVGQSGSNHALAQYIEGGNSHNLQAEQRHVEHVQHVERAVDYGEQIMPPVAASRLPSLVTSQSIGIPPLPVATATARMGARAEMNIEEDLDMLAAKIKRILDDEARRHGIDV